MASISSPEVDVAIGKNSNAWGTVQDLTSVGKLVHCRSIGLQADFGEFKSQEMGFDFFYTECVRLALTVNVTLTFDLSYNSHFNQLFAAFMGVDSSSLAGGTTAYQHLMQLQSNNVGKHLTLAWKIEDDATIEIPSLKVASMTISSETNNVGTVTFNCIGDRLVARGSATNTTTILNALTYPSYQAAPLGSLFGTNHYCRIHDYSTGTALSSSHDRNILSYNLNIQRPLQPLMPLRGALSPYTMEPFQVSPTTGTFSFLLYRLDDADMNLIGDWQVQTKKMAEIYLDGAVIASGGGLNRSIKLQLPYMDPGPSIPTGHDFSGFALMQQGQEYQLLQAGAAPAGMSGVTNVCRVVSVDERATAYI